MLGEQREGRCDCRWGNEWRGDGKWNQRGRQESCHAESWNNGERLHYILSELGSHQKILSNGFLLFKRSLWLLSREWIGCLPFLEQYVRHHAEHFIFFVWFNLHKKFTGYIIFFPFSKRGNWGSESSVTCPRSVSQSVVMAVNNSGHQYFWFPSPSWIHVKL